MIMLGIIHNIYSHIFFQHFLFRIQGKSPAVKPTGTISMEDDEKKQLLSEIANNNFFIKVDSGFSHNIKKQ